MRFYTGQHQYYCGVDLHARTLYLCVLDAHGKKRVHKRVRSEPAAFLEAIEPYREGLVVGVECIFCWYCSRIFARASRSRSSSATPSI